MFIEISLVTESRKQYWSDKLMALYNRWQETHASKLITRLKLLAPVMILKNEYSAAGNHTDISKFLL